MKVKNGNSVISCPPLFKIGMMRVAFQYQSPVPTLIVVWPMATRQKPFNAAVKSLSPRGELASAE